MNDLGRILGKEPIKNIFTYLGERIQVLEKKHEEEERGKLRADRANSRATKKEKVLGSDAGPSEYVANEEDASDPLPMQEWDVRSFHDARRVKGKIELYTRWLYSRDDLDAPAVR
eukprot:jgi/Mesvir1/18720/Mv01234-RA.1